ncbi:FAD-dependent oxidoreductase [Nonomuraea sp. NPDC055795]
MSAVRSDKESVAVIGSGVAGLTAAYLLRRRYDVTLFEADDRFGGHAHTHDIRTPDGACVPIDTGFIVHNTRTYPALRRLFAELGVRTSATEMSLGVSCEECGLEYSGGRNGKGLPPGGPPRVWAAYARLLAEVLRFHRDARRLLKAGADPGVSFGEFLSPRRYSRYFVDHFALPLVAAVWSMAEDDALTQHAWSLLSFLDNHAMLSVTGRVPWRTVVGGSRAYVDRITVRDSTSHDLTARSSTPIRAVRRHDDGVEIADASGGWHEASKVVIATHADQALALLTDATLAEKRVLGAFRYSRNRILLHTDTSALPRARRARASWNLRKRSCQGSGPITVTYHMNRLMMLSEPVDYLVTLNNDEIDQNAVLASAVYEHPILDASSFTAQRLLPELTSATTAYAGAYHGWGFHEDGCVSGVRAAAAFGVRW